MRRRIWAQQGTLRMWRWLPFSARRANQRLANSAASILTQTRSPTSRLPRFPRLRKVGSVTSVMRWPAPGKPAEIERGYEACQLVRKALCWSQESAHPHAKAVAAALMPGGWHVRPPQRLHQRHITTWLLPSTLVPWVESSMARHSNFTQFISRHKSSPNAFPSIMSIYCN
jgi:hypothetical protein